MHRMKRSRQCTDMLVSQARFLLRQSHFVRQHDDDLHRLDMSHQVRRCWQTRTIVELF
jgi:hypothetical protein